MSKPGATHAATRLAASQHGRISYGQLCACGVNSQWIHDQVETGWLHLEHHEVYAVGYPGQTIEGHWIGAQLALGPRSALSHRSAGALWTIAASRMLEVTVPTLDGRRPRDNIVVHRSPLPAEHVCLRRGIRTTTLVRTLLDLAAVLPLKRVGDAFEEAQVLHGLPPVVLAEQVALRAGYRGNGKLRVLLQGAVDPGLVRSRLELRFFMLCAEHGIERPVTNVDVGPWNVDFLWPVPRLVVETDGALWHATAAKRRRDAAKTEWLESRGWRVIRLRWVDVNEHATPTAAILHAALAAAP